ncbi:MAG: hypothetical protein SOV24_00140 [Muribaculaceae bacterium]|nr:hypothetical protein [Bacteroidales bacterium]MDY2732769.1 hypothetical protein [Muribaculaceae bacterium]
MKIIRLINKTLLLVGIACLTLGCARKVYLPVERVLTDTIRRIECRVDTIAWRDSIYVGARGDTIVKEVYRWRQRVHTRVDTIYRVKKDSVDTTAATSQILQTEEKQAKERKYATLITLATRLAILLTLIIILFRHLRRMHNT